MKILVTGAWKCTDDEIKRLYAMGHSVVFMQNEKDELPLSAEEIEGVICNGLFLYHDIEEFTSLKYIQLTSAGLDRVPVEYINEKGIALLNARGVYSVPMAEYAVWGVLALYRNATIHHESKKAHAWNKVRSVMELSGKTVLIVGCGSVGGECAKRFSAMGCRVIGVDIADGVDEYYEKIVSIDGIESLVSEADVVVLTIPHTDKTHRLFNAELIEKMKSTAVLVNIARGGVVDSTALEDALASGKIFGAVLDVFDEEPLVGESPLWDLPNVIITPHNSFVGENNHKRLSKVILDNLSEHE